MQTAYPFFSTPFSTNRIQVFVTLRYAEALRNEQNEVKEIACCQLKKMAQAWYMVRLTGKCR